MALQSSMTEVMRLTRVGRLAEATALIRTTLGGGSGSPAVQEPTADAIDLVPERVTVTRHDSPQARPDGARGSFEPRHHAGSAGTIDYMLYRPKSAASGMPLVIMLHGCTQSPEDFARGTAMNTLADELGLLVAYPRQTATANLQKCWNWFQPGNQKRGCGEPALIAGLTRDIVATERADAGRIYVAGLSAGGAAAAIMAETYPDLFAAVGIHSGLACGAAQDLPSALAAMKRGPASNAPRAPGNRFVPVITFHGDRDQTVHEVNARAIVATASAATGVTLTTEMQTGEAGGRRYARTMRRNDAGQVLVEQWTIAGAGHAWSGGDPGATYADANGPDASRAMLRFFLDHSTSVN